MVATTFNCPCFRRAPWRVPAPTALQPAPTTAPAGREGLARADNASLTTTTCLTDLTTSTTTPPWTKIKQTSSNRRLTQSKNLRYKPTGTQPNSEEPAAEL